MRENFLNRCGRRSAGTPWPSSETETATLPHRGDPDGPVANTDTKLLIYGLFQKGRVLAQDGMAGPGIEDHDAHR